MKLMSEKEIKVGITKVEKKNHEFRLLIQSVALGVIGHAIMHGNVTPATQLIEAAPETRRQAIVNYLSEHGPFTWDSSKAAFKKNSKWEKVKLEMEGGVVVKSDENIAEVEKYLDAVIADPRGPWYEMTKATLKNVKPYDLLTDVTSLIKRVERHIEKKERVDHSGLFDYLQIALTQYKEDSEAATDDDGVAPVENTGPKANEGVPTQQREMHQVQPQQLAA